MAHNRFLTKEWQIAHLKDIKRQAGFRYTPELNVKLPIAEIFDGISRNEKFYTSIQKNYGELNRHFNQISLIYSDKKIQKIYDDLKYKIVKLLEELSCIKGFNTRKIQWKEINRLIEKANSILWKISRELENLKTRSENNSALGNDNLYYLRKTREKLEYFQILSSNNKGELANTPFLLLTGPAGRGKTHLLCDVVECRTEIGNLFPSVLVFGEKFVTDEEPILQIIRQLELSVSKRNFLAELNTAGEEASCRAIIAIDALNETGKRNYWKRNLGKVVDEIKKYPNIALVISIRSGFEDELMTKKAKKNFINKEHEGFQFREWEAVNKFFTEFSIPLPEIPLLLPEFQEPLFLLLFCKAFENRTSISPGRQIFRGHEGATYIFESVVKSISKEITKELNIPNKPRRSIWNTIIKEIAARMVEQKKDRISEEQLIPLLKKSYPEIEPDNFIKTLERNMLLVKVPRYSIDLMKLEECDFRFPFQKFSDHLIGRYIFKEYEKEFGKGNKNLVTAKKFFSKRKKLGKFLLESNSRGIIEALSIQCPEHLKGYELVDVAPYVKDLHWIEEAFIESLIWRKPTAFSEDMKNTYAYINSRIINKKIYYDYFLTAILSVSSIPKHPFNAYSLHKYLFKYSMAERDHHWSIFLHYQYGERNSIDRLIEWGWSGKGKNHINDESILLCSIALAWFLTSSNRFIRDKSTKALVLLLTGKLHVVLALLKKFNKVNDPYISERLYAVAYGCVIRNGKDKKALKNLSQWVYNNIFKDNSPPIHILLRDYARGIIEFSLREHIPIRLDKKKINPPYESKFPSRFPSNKTIKRYEFDYNKKNFKKHYWAQNVIVNSMQPNTQLKLFMYGDFGRYVFQSALSYFNYPNNVTFQKLSNWAVKRVFDLGYNVNLHGEFDRNVNRYGNSGRSEHKAERIGKKYQWIAFHELLALVSDRFEIEKERFSDNIVPYEGPWQLSVRNIDPTCVLREFQNERPKGLPVFSNHENRKQYNVWQKNFPLSKWLKTVKDLPDPKRLIEFMDCNKVVWMALDRFDEWKEKTPPEQEEYRYPEKMLWYIIKSYLVENRSKCNMLQWASAQRFEGRWMPESREFYNVHLGEYPCAPAFLYHYNPYYHHDKWTDGGGRIPEKILVTDDEYLSSGSLVDCSSSEAIRVKLPAKFIVDGMNLSQTYTDGRFFDNKGDLVAFDPAVFDKSMPRYLLIRKDKLCSFLKQNKYALLWTILGEKNSIGGNEIGQSHGRLHITGAYTLDSKNKIKGKKRSYFEQS